MHGCRLEWSLWSARRGQSLALRAGTGTQACCGNNGVGATGGVRIADGVKFRPFYAIAGECAKATRKRLIFVTLVLPLGHEAVQ
jgi:hypothetical protein